MKERPILFSGPLVRAILDGRKTQTRRVIKHPPPDDVAPISVSRYHPTIIDRHGDEAPGAEIFGASSDDGEWGCKSPFGEPGDRLWVRETHIAYGRWETRFSEKKGRDEWHFVDMTLQTGREYRYDGAVPNAKRGGATPAWWRRPSIFMPRAASRTLLEVTGVRVERLQSISENDAIAEGIEPFYTDDPDLQEMWRDYSEAGMAVGNPIGSFMTLWDSINAGAGTGWNANPWIWVVEFRRIER